MRAREALFQSPLFGEDINKIPPIVNPNGSDSSMFDNVLELMVLSGRSMPHAVMMMIPEPWSKHATMDPARKAFYQYHSSLMEPWDGPADICFTDGKRIGAVLDRNGLRPALLRDHRRLCVMGRKPACWNFRPRTSCARGVCSPGAFPRGHRLAASSKTKRSSRRSSTSDRTPSGSSSTWCTSGSAGGARTARAGARGIGQTPAVVRLHVRRPAHSHDADGA